MVKAQVGSLTISCIAKVAKRSVRRGTIHAARMSHRKGALILSITKKFGSDEEAEFNLGEAGQAFPSDLVAWRRIIRAGEIASQPSELNEIRGNRGSLDSLSFSFC